MGLFYVRVDVRSHVNNGPLNNLCIVCMWRCIVSWCSLISPCEWCGSWKWVTVSLVMAMARRTWSVATGLAHDTLGENLTCPTPSKDCFFGLVSYVVSYVVFWLFFTSPLNGSERFRGIPPWKRHEKTYVRTHVRTHVTTQVKVSERFQNGSGVFPPEKGMKNLRKNSRKNSHKNSRNNPGKGFWTVQNGSGVFPPEKGMKNLPKNSRNNPGKGFWTVRG